MGIETITFEDVNLKYEVTNFIKVKIVSKILGRTILSNKLLLTSKVVFLINTYFIVYFY